jgi:hypothetical protein
MYVRFDPCDAAGSIPLSLHTSCIPLIERTNLP